MTRAHLIEQVAQEVEQHGIKIYIGRNDRMKIEGTIHYTDEHEEGPYFYGPEGGFQILYPHAKPIGVVGPDTTTIFWSDMGEALEQLKKATP